MINICHTFYLCIEKCSIPHYLLILCIQILVRTIYTDHIMKLNIIQIMDYYIVFFFQLKKKYFKSLILVIN